MKKTIAAGLAMVMAVTMVACNSGGNDKPTTSAENTPAQTQASKPTETPGQSLLPTETVGETLLHTQGTEIGEKYEEMHIKGDGHSIPSIVMMPDGATEDNPVPAVIMLHGTGSNKDEAGNGYKDFAPLLAEAGIASIRIDFAGSGDSTGDYKDYNYKSAAADADAAFEHIAAMPGIDSERIGIMGWSQGGTNALLTAAWNDKYKSVLTWAGALDLSILYTDEMKSEAEEKGFAVMEFEWREPLNLGKDWIEQVEATDVEAEIKKIKAPICAINGAKDDVVVPETADKIVGASSNAESKKVIIDDADHTFNLFTEDRTAFEKLSEETINWFKATL